VPDPTLGVLNDDLPDPDTATFRRTIFSISALSALEALCDYALCKLILSVGIDLKELGVSCRNV